MSANTTVITKATETVIEGVPGGVSGDGGAGCIEGWGGIR